MLVAKYLVERLQEEIGGATKPNERKRKAPRAKTAAKHIFQFKITLLESQPPIWRRIQVEDCTLDKLHEHIQTAMGWTNSHLHQFEITDQRYGDPDLLEEDFEEFGYINSTHTKISQILPKDRTRFRFIYEYDFGDDWLHEVLFEGCPKPQPRKKYPLCLEGERACPPEDVGGIGGYAEFLEALADPQHEEHAAFLQWSGPFNPDEFDAQAATKAMKEGLPNWRD